MSLVTLNTSNWTPMGPAPIHTAGGLDVISGRIQASAPDPTDPATIYLGADNGGIWKNVNPPQWTPLTDFMPSPSVSGYHPLVVHPANPDLILALVSGPGAGILKSTDAGKTWNLLANGQFEGQALNALAVHPTDTNTMYLSASWFGIWKSTDGGATWTQLNKLPTGSVSDLIRARFDSKVFYAGVVGNTGAKQAQNGVYKSTDSGATWNLLGGLPSGAALGGDGASGAVRIDSCNASGVVYVSMITVAPNPTPPPAVKLNAIQRFRTSDGGATWTALAATAGSFENRSWHLLIASDPTNEKHVFANDAYSLFESWDSGKTWSQADLTTGYLKGGKNHFDWVNLTFDANGHAVLTADQGAFRYDPVTQAWTSLVHNLQVSEFYTVGLDPNSGGIAYAIGQDIFSEKFTGQTDWNLMQGGVGETGKIIVDPKNSSQLFGFNPLDTTQFVLQSPDGGTTWTTIFPVALLSASFIKIYNQSTGYNFAYASQKAFAMDPTNPARLLVVADRVFETKDAFSASPTWTQISGILSTDANNPFVIAIGIAPSDPDIVYASTQDGHLWVTYNDGATWAEWDSGISGSVIDIRIDPNDGNHAFAVTSRGVWHLQASGLPWVKVTGNLPNNLNFYTIFVVWQPANPALFVGTDRGLYRSFDLGKTWNKWGPALPNTRVNDLQGEMLGGQLMLVAGMFGRGAWGILLSPWGSVATAIPDTGSFGNVCTGSFADELLTINNNGWGPLLISNITSSNPEFQPPGVLSYPILLNAGESIDVVIRFQPASVGFKVGTITILSDDPAGPHTIAVSGDAPAPRLSSLIADTGAFGKVCVGSLVDKPLILNNSGKCMLTITGISSSSAEFVVPQVLSFPLSVAAGSFLMVPIRFAPASFGSKSATVTVNSNDPSGPHTVAVSGEAPSGNLTVAGSTHFGGVKCCHREQRVLSICNTGDCALNVSNVGFKHKRRCYRLIGNPFPAVVRPGSCLSVIIEYFADEKIARGADLLIQSDDPADPIRNVEILAYTIWDCCDRCGKESCKCDCCKPCRDDDDDEAQGE